MAEVADMALTPPLHSTREIRRWSRAVTRITLETVRLFQAIMTCREGIAIFSFAS
jgi:hypothetical protein